MLRKFAWLLPVALLSACASGPRSPAPVESRTGTETAAAASTAQVRPYRPAQAPSQARPLAGSEYPGYPAEPAPVQGQSGQPASQQLAIARPQPARAVQVLMRRADDQYRAGDYSAAAASLERGLRIEPRNARLWNKLARTRAAQQQYDRVEQFAAKSNALAGADAALIADNWHLIAQARAARGDRSGAAEASRRATVSR